MKTKRFINAQLPRILADVELLAPKSIEGWMEKIQLLFNGFVFQPSDRYDEVPAYEAHRAGMEFVLFGVPKGEVGNCMLSFSCNPNTAQLMDLPQFFDDALRGNKQPARTGYAYYSHELAQALYDLGEIKCDAVDFPG